MSFFASLIAFSRLLLSFVFCANKYPMYSSSNFACIVVNCSNLVMSNIKSSYDTRVRTVIFISVNYIT